VKTVAASPALFDQLGFGFAGSWPPFSQSSGGFLPQIRWGRRTQRASNTSLRHIAKRSTLRN
jgi:hypothetical protein